MHPFRVLINPVVTCISKLNGNIDNLKDDEEDYVLICFQKGCKRENHGCCRHSTCLPTDGAFFFLFFWAHIRYEAVCKWM